MDEALLLALDIVHDDVCAGRVVDGLLVNDADVGLDVLLEPEDIPGLCAADRCEMDAMDMECQRLSTVKRGETLIRDPTRNVAASDERRNSAHLRQTDPEEGE